jgi:hypothetical protein
VRCGGIGGAAGAGAQSKNDLYRDPPSEGSLGLDSCFMRCSVAGYPFIGDCAGQPGALTPCCARHEEADEEPGDPAPCHDGLHKKNGTSARKTSLSVSVGEKTNKLSAP